MKKEIEKRRSKNGEAEKGEMDDMEEEEENEPFEDVVKDCEVMEGLFTFYRNRENGDVFMEIRPGQFDKIFLCSITRESGDGHFFDSAAIMDQFPFVFRRVGFNVMLIHKNVYYRADRDSAVYRAVSRGVSDSIVGNAHIESEPHPKRGSVLVNPSGFFIQDIGMVSHFFSNYADEGDAFAGYDFDDENSYFGRIKSFPENTEIEVLLHFSSSNPIHIPTVSDSRSFFHTYHYSLSTLPETNYNSRVADDRVGHFLTMYQDYNSVLRDTPYRRYINRWHLEKAEPKFPLSKPKKPIVFWLENTIPPEYRDAIREGVLVWNKAFEAIGFRDAIVVRQQADDADWDPADVRYNTVRWIVSPGRGYAVGPSRANPFTGQIYDADIRISADFVRYIFHEYEEFAEPVAIVNSLKRPPGMAKCFRGCCDYQWEAAKHAAFGWSVATVRGNGAIVDMQTYLHDFLVHLVAHEVGHTLGLRHNFKASSVLKNDRLHDAKTTSERGLSGSVMDYLPVNIAPEGMPQGQYFQTNLGPYDYWAIEYAYKTVPAGSHESETEMLEKIASRVAEPQLAYGTDEDAMWWTTGIDPVCNRGDLGSDPIAFYTDRVGLSKELWRKMTDKFETKGQRYQKFRKVFNHGIWEYFGAVLNVTKFVGGIYYHRDHVGDPNGRIPLEPVGADRQREAMAFLQTHIFGADAFHFPPELLNRLAPERYWDFSGSIWEVSRIDYPIHDIVLAIQGMPLEYLYDPVLLSRMQDIELRYGGGEEPFALADMFPMIRDAVWTELSGPANVNSFRRALQRKHLGKIIALFVEKPEGVPEEARTPAHADLLWLKKNIETAATGKGLNDHTASHLNEMKSRIDAALKAHIEWRY